MPSDASSRTCLAQDAGDLVPWPRLRDGRIMGKVRTARTAGICRAPDVTARGGRGPVRTLSRHHPVLTPARPPVTRDTVCATVCQPWCAAGDGHPGEFVRADQICLSDEVVVRLRLHHAMEQMPGIFGPAQLRVSCSQGAEAGARVHLTGVCDVELTPGEAQETMAALSFVLRLLARCDADCQGHRVLGRGTFSPSSTGSRWVVR